jgi:hypothetical protein
MQRSINAWLLWSAGYPLSNHKKRRWVPVYVACVLFLIVYYMALIGRGLTPFYQFIYSRDQDSAMAHLADSFLQGRVDLLVDPDPALYDPAAPDHIYHLQYRTEKNKNFIWDYSYYKNKSHSTPRYYLYFGPGIIILFYIPVKLLFHFYFCEGTVLLIMSSLNLIIFAYLLRFMVKSWFDNVPLYLQALIILTYGCCNFMSYFMERPQIYELAIAAGVLCSLCCLAGIMRGIVEKTWKRYFWFWIAGTSMGAATACRFDDVLLAPALGVTWLYCLFESGFKDWLKTALANGLFLFSSPFLIGLALMWYNYVRFDNPFETGVRYMLNSIQTIDANLFSVYYIPDGIWTYYFKPYQIISRFPYIDYWDYVPQFLYAESKGRSSNAGLLPVFPIVIFGFLWPYYWLKIKEIHTRSQIGVFGMIVSLWQFFVAFALAGFFASTMRYEAEIQMPMLILSTIAVLNRRHVSGKWLWWKTILLSTATLYSLWMGFVFALIGPWNWILFVMTDRK